MQKNSSQLNKAFQFNNGIKDEKSVWYRLTITENVITCCVWPRAAGENRMRRR